MFRKYSKYNDSKLIALAAKGGNTGEQAFVELYNRYSVNVRTYCKCVINNITWAEEIAADDIFQDTFILLHKKIHEGLEIKNVQSYLIAIARNLCMNFMRNRKITVPIAPDLLIVDERTDYEKSEMFDLIIKALSTLESKYREAFVLREFEGMKFREIAEICDVTIPGAKTRVQRAHKLILRLLSPYINDMKY